MQEKSKKYRELAAEIEIQFSRRFASLHGCAGATAEAAAPARTEN